jgi:hypothetical protein
MVDLLFEEWLRKALYFDREDTAQIRILAMNIPDHNLQNMGLVK